MINQLAKKRTFNALKIVNKHRLLDNEVLFDSFDDKALRRRFHVFTSLKADIIENYKVFLKIRYQIPPLKTTFKDWLGLTEKRYEVQL